MSIARRAVAAALSLCMLCSCATILYPERKGNAGGAIDVGPLVLDCLWFIPGIVPGIIALVVDFSTGAIYTGGGKKKSGKVEVGPEGEIAIHKPEVEQATHVELRLVDSDDRVLAADTVTWHPEVGDDEPVSVSLADAAARLPEDEPVSALHLELVVDGGDAVRYPLQLRKQGLPATTETLPVPLPVLASR